MVARLDCAGESEDVRPGGPVIETGLPLAAFAGGIFYPARLWFGSLRVCRAQDQVWIGPLDRGCRSWACVILRIFGEPLGADRVLVESLR